MSIDHAKKRILDQVPLEGLIGEDIKLTNKGGHFGGLCPFHDEKSPSFVVYSDHYHCFGCQAHGDAITYVREKKGLGFLDALRFLSNKYGLDASELDSSKHDTQQARTLARYFRLMSTAQELFEETLWSTQGSEARQYLGHRGFSDEFIKAYGFGLSPPEPSKVTKKLLALGFSEQEIFAGSLAFKSTKSNATVDFFRGRVTIPIHDSFGRLIAFGGRALGDMKPKYKNSSETSLFDKSQTIFGFHLARQHIATKRRCIIVEGYMDALSLWSHGFPEAVACMGTALTIHHLRALGHASKEIYLLFDSDQGGYKAGLRAVNLALQLPQLSIKVAKLPEDQDPDSFVRSQPLGSLDQVLTESMDLLTYAINEKIKGAHQMEVLHLLKQEFIPWLKTIRDPLNRSYVVGHLSTQTKIPRSAIEAALTQQQHDASPSVTPPETMTPSKSPDLGHMEVPPLEALEDELFAHLYFAEPGDISDDAMVKWMETSLDLHPVWLQLANGFIASLLQGNSPSKEPLITYECAVIPKVHASIEGWKRRQELFTLRSGETRKQMLTKLSTAFEIKRLRNVRFQFKQELALGLSGSTSDHQAASSIQVLGAIQKINQRLKRLESGEIAPN